MENVLRTPWRVEPTDRWPGLFTVRDCDENIVAAAKIEVVARLIATAPELNVACLAAAEQVQALRNAISALESTLYAILEPTITLELDWSPLVTPVTIFTFAPNGTVTYEECPVCREPNITVEHGKDSYERPMHFEHCPECGDSMHFVCYDCPDCKEAGV